MEEVKAKVRYAFMFIWGVFYGVCSGLIITQGSAAEHNPLMMLALIFSMVLVLVSTAIALMNIFWFLLEMW